VEKQIVHEFTKEQIELLYNATEQAAKRMFFREFPKTVEKLFEMKHRTPSSLGVRLDIDFQ